MVSKVPGSNELRRSIKCNIKTEPREIAFKRTHLRKTTLVNTMEKVTQPKFSIRVLGSVFLSGSQILFSLILQCQRFTHPTLEAV